MTRIRTHTNPLNYFTRMPPINWKTQFSDYPGFFDFEIGFGRGKFITEYAQNNPKIPIVGVEVRKQPVEILKKRVCDLKLSNVYLIHGNAQIVLEDTIETPQIRHCFIFHPDPWFKKSHHKRRVVQPIFIKTLHQKMLTNGKIYLSTDVGPLWEAMVETINQSGLFEEVVDPLFWETQYHTNWQAWSITDKRNSFIGTFQRKLP